MKLEDIISSGRPRRKRRGQRNTPRPGPDLVTQDLKEGGHMQGVGAIHIDEIKPTLQRLEKDIGMDLQNNVLGSVGKKEFSGDIDVAIQMSPEKFEEFKAVVDKSPIVYETVKGPLVLMSRVKIQGYDPNRKTDRKRTGFVQVDYMMDDDPEWLKTFYHAPSETESRYKGAHRNIAIGALSQFVDREEGYEKTDDGRPVKVERYMFSSNKGLVRVIRRLKPRKDGKGYTKSWDNEIIDGPWRRGDDIAKQLRLGDATDLNSFETILAAIEKNHPQLVEPFARAFAADQNVQELGVPEEIKKYL